MGYKIGRSPPDIAVSDEESGKVTNSFGVMTVKYAMAAE